MKMHSTELVIKRFLHQEDSPTDFSNSQSHRLYILVKGLFIYDVSQKWGVWTPPPPLVSQNQQLAYLPSPLVRKKSENS